MDNSNRSSLNPKTPTPATPTTTPEQRRIASLEARLARYEQRLKVLEIFVQQKRRIPETHERTNELAQLALNVELRVAAHWSAERTPLELRIVSRNISRKLSNIGGIEILKTELAQRGKVMLLTSYSGSQFFLPTEVFTSASLSLIDAFRSYGIPADKVEVMRQRSWRMQEVQREETARRESSTLINEELYFPPEE